MSLHHFQKTLQAVADDFRPRSYVPYSGRESAAVVLLANGTMVPGVRVENASFSLTISAIQNAVTTAVAYSESEIVALSSNEIIDDGETAYLGRLPGTPLRAIDSDFFSALEITALPDPSIVLEPLTALPPTLLPDNGISAAREVSGKALVSESDFPVGCLLQTDSNFSIVGVNVEHADWSRILCAERNALGTAITYNAGDIRNVFISAPRDPNASPCGACRQVLVELAQRATVWMDRGENPAMGETCSQLLPYYFSGHTIQKPSIQKPSIQQPPLSKPST